MENDLTDMIYPHIYHFISAKSPISAETWKEFEKTFNFVTYKKSDYIARPEDDPSKISFVLKGIIRNYFIHPSGREYTKTFRGPSGLVGSYKEILEKTNTKYFIQAVTNCEVVQFNYKDFEKLMDTYKDWERLGRIVAEENYLEKEKREYMLMYMNIEEKYEEFLNDFSPFINDIPQYQIASYIGVSPESFNRFLNKK